MAILLMKNTQIEDWTRFLQENDIPITSKKSTNILKNPYIQLLFCFLKTLILPLKENEDMIKVLRHPVWGLDQ